MKKFFSLLCFFLFFSMLSQAQNELFLKKEFIYKGDTLPYRILYPENYNKSASYPLVLFLHGAGEEEMIMKNNWYMELRFSMIRRTDKNSPLLLFFHNALKMAFGHLSRNGITDFRS